MRDADGKPLYHLVTSSLDRPMLSIDPIGYYDKNLTYHPWDPSAVERPQELITSYYNTEFLQHSDLSHDMHAQLQGH